MALVRDIALLRIPTGDSIPDTIVEWARSAAVSGGTVLGLGAAYDVEIGYFHRDRREYSRRRLDGDVEIVALVGNLALKEGAPYAHLHVTVAGPDGIAHAGHFFAGRAAATCEVSITVFDRPVQRSEDPATGLWLLDLHRR